MRNTSTYLKVMQAQLISRLGFVTDEMAFRERQTIDAINERAANIGSESAECIIDARLSLDNAIEYVGYSVNGAIGEAMFYINQIEREYFYPYIHALQLESNVIQWTVVSELRRINPVTDGANLITRLEGDYFINLVLYQAAVEQIPREMGRLDNRMNEVKRSMFPQLNGIRDYFGFTADIIKDSLPTCVA